MRFVSTYVPSTSLVVSRTTPVFVWVALTLAPGTAKPDASWIDPWNCAVDWARRPQLSTRKNTPAKRECIRVATTANTPTGFDVRFDASFIFASPCLWPTSCLCSSCDDDHGRGQDRLRQPAPFPGAVIALQARSFDPSHSRSKRPHWI